MIMVYSTKSKSIILAIDAGSSSVRCTAYEYHGDNEEDTHDIDDNINNDPSSSRLVTAMDSISHTISMSAINSTTGHIYVHHVLSAIDKCVDEVLCLLRSTHNFTSSNGYQIVALGFSTFVMNLVGVDVNGDPVSDVATCSYACNRDDVVRECEDLRNKLGLEKLSVMYQHTGTPLHVSYALPQLIAFYKNDNNAEIAKQIDKWQTISSICLHRWCGRQQSSKIPISFSEASWTGMLNFRTCAWDDETVNVLKSYQGKGNVQQHECQSEDDEYQDDNIDLLTPLVDFDASLPFLRGGIPQFNDDGSNNSYWERWPELQNPSLRMFFGIGDGAAANIGSKCGTKLSESDVQRIACTIGTSAAARVCLPLPLTASDDDRITVPPVLFCYRVNKDVILLGGALTDGGSVVEWARNLFSLQSTESFETCLAEVTSMYERRCVEPPSSESLDMIPFLTGERSTGYRSGARGCISGISRATTYVDIMHSCLEAVILRLCSVIRLIESVCSSRQERVIVASGNALECNSLWRQMLADCSSNNVIIDAEANEGTSRGIAILIACSIRRENANNMNCSIEEQLIIKSKTTTNIQTKEYWEKASSAQESLIDAVIGPSLFSS